MPTPNKKTVYKALDGRTYNTRNEAVAANRSYYTAKRLQEQTNKIPVTYIGGTPEQARAEFWRQEPVLQHAVDSVGKLYGINPDIIKYRLNHEGFVDDNIKIRNNDIQNNYNIRRGYNILNFPTGPYEASHHFGFDDYGTYLENGNIQLSDKKRFYDTVTKGKKEYRPASYWTVDFDNEKGRKTNAAIGSDVADAFGMTAAGLKYFRDKAKEDYPDTSDYDLNRYANAYFNRGIVGGRKWVNDGAKGYNYRRSLETGARREYRDGGVYIAPSKRGTLTAEATKHGMSAMAFAHKVMANKDNYSSKMVKKANFVINFNS